MNEQTLVIIDTDLSYSTSHADIDDAIALLLALAQPDWKILAITPVSGNTYAERASWNIDRLLSRVGRSDIPHAFGAGRPMDPLRWTETHRWINLPGETLPSFPENSVSPVALLIKTLLEAPRKATVVTIGPLTNMAAAYTLNPGIAEKVDRVLSMAGSWRTPGAQFISEFNILSDPFSASVVFNSPLPVTLFGLDVTKKQHIKPESISLWDHTRSPIVQELHDKAVAFMHFRAKRDGYSDPYTFFHDAMPVLFDKHPSLFKLSPCNISVDTDGEYTRGNTVIDFKDRTRSGFKHQIAVDVDSDLFLELVLETIRDKWGDCV